MRFQVALFSLCTMLSLTTTRAASQCGPKMESQIASVRDSWVKNWNEGRLDSVVNLYYRYADLLPSDGSRAHGQDEIREAFQKQIGSKIEVHSLAFACSDAFAYENGTYTETGNRQSIEGNYLVVMVWRDDKWLIVQHSSTAKQPIK